MPWYGYMAIGDGLLLSLVLWDIVQVRHAIRRNFPLLDRIRYLFEPLSPPLRQYFVTSDTEERPFDRIFPYPPDDVCRCGMPSDPD